MSCSDNRKPLMTACQGAPPSSAISQAILREASSIDTRFERGKASWWGTTPFATWGRGNCPRREMMVAIPWKPSRRAPISTSTMVSPDPITAIDCALAGGRRGGGGAPCTP